MLVTTISSIVSESSAQAMHGKSATSVAIFIISEGSGECGMQALKKWWAPGDSNPEPMD